MGLALISVVIPAYNAAGTLEATVKSVFEQSVQDFEIIIVDDGSKDTTLQVAQSIASRDLRVRLISQHNSGASAARNTGVKAAIGEYVAFLDADDLWMPHKLERQLEVLNGAKDITAVQSGVYYVNNDLEIISVGRCFESKDVLLETLFFQNLPGLMSTLIVKRDRFDLIGLFNTKLVILEDWEMAIRLSRYCNLKSIEEPLALYRQFPGNRSRDLSIHIEPGHIALGRLFADPTLPTHIKKQEKQIYAAFYTMLCGGAYKISQYKEALRWGIKAVATHPTALSYIASLPLRKLQRNSTRENVPPEYASAVENFLKS